MHQVKSELNGRTLALAFDGELEEGVVLPTLDLAAIDTVSIDLNNLHRLNSQGIRIWTMWIGKIALTKHVTTYLDNCPMLFLQNASAFSNMVPNQVVVRSAYFPFVTVIGGEDRVVKVDLTQFNDRTEAEKFLRELQSPDGEEIEPDFFPQKILFFLKSE